MPDSRRPPRRNIESRLVSRVIAHLAVIGLVAFSSAIGLAAAGDPAAPATAAVARPFTLNLVSAVRGADVESAPLSGGQFDLQPEAGRPAPDNEPLRMPQATSTPKPTPAPIATDATPLPAPTSVSVGSVQTAPQPVAVAPQPVPAPAPDSTGQLAWPVPGGSISQYFSAGHLAIDIAASAGGPVVAAEAGVVVWAGWKNNGGGLVIDIDHGNGIVTSYNHLGSVWVGPGQAVGRGEGIAGVGCTGLCTGPHVHFEVTVGGVIQNPLRYL